MFIVNEVLLNSPGRVKTAVKGIARITNGNPGFIRWIHTPIEKATPARANPIHEQIVYNYRRAESNLTKGVQRR